MQYTSQPGSHLERGESEVTENAMPGAGLTARLLGNVVDSRLDLLGAIKRKVPRRNKITQTRPTQKEKERKHSGSSKIACVGVKLFGRVSKLHFDITALLEH